MIETTVVVAGCALVLAVAVGLVAHEWAHAMALRLVHIEYTIAYFPDRTDGLVGLLASCPWAAVQPHPTERASALHLRAAALAPSLLAAPVFVVGIHGIVPTESPIVMAIAIGWLACSIPSPQDFSVAFYAHRMLATEAAPDPNAATPATRAD